MKAVIRGSARHKAILALLKAGDPNGELKRQKIFIGLIEKIKNDDYHICGYCDICFYGHRHYDAKYCSNSCSNKKRHEIECKEKLASPPEHLMPLRDVFAPGLKSKRA